MEGLIPLVCKTFKRNKTLRKYESLSSGSNNIIEDFYPEYANSNDYDYGVQNYAEYRRTQSLRANYALEKRVSSPKDKQLVRFTSHRMFSCVTGA